MAVFDANRKTWRGGGVCKYIIMASLNLIWFTIAVQNIHGTSFYVLAINGEAYFDVFKRVLDTWLIRNQNNTCLSRLGDKKKPTRSWFELVYSAGCISILHLFYHCPSYIQCIWIQRRVTTEEDQRDPFERKPWSIFLNTITVLSSSDHFH